MDERVVIIPNERQKFVLVQTKNGLLLQGNPKVRWHKDIVDAIEDTQVLEVLGGGWLMLKSKENTIYFWGKSDRYGGASMNSVKEIVLKMYPNIQVNLGTEPL